MILRKRAKRITECTPALIYSALIYNVTYATHVLSTIYIVFMDKFLCKNFIIIENMYESSYLQLQNF